MSCKTLEEVESGDAKGLWRRSRESYVDMCSGCKGKVVVRLLRSSIDWGATLPHLIPRIICGLPGRERDLALRMHSISFRTK